MKNSTFFLLMAFLAASFLSSCDTKGDRQDPNVLGREFNVGKTEGEEIAVLTVPPNVPPPITRKHNTKVIVNLEVIEKEMEIADGVKYMFWTYGGSVPGLFIRVKEGDYVEFHLKNHPNNMLPHNIDLHAVTGQGGGAEATFTAPGYQTTFYFTALNPGLYVYHCATAPVGMHIGNGMYGLILVEPKEGLPPVDKEFYVMQGDFYTKGKNGDQGLQAFDMEKAIKEQPEYVLFNGRMGSMLGENTLKAKAGETIRLFVGNGGPNLTSSFHVIGEIFDNVNVEGGSLINHDVQTTVIPPGGAAITEFKVEVPGNFILVDHALFRTFNKGSLGILAVEGSKNIFIYSGKKEAEVYLPEGPSVQTMPDGNKGPVAAMTKEELMAMGKNLYNSICAACHQPDGAGIAGAFPPLIGSDYFASDPLKISSTIVNGLSGEVIVNGKKYNSVMPKQNLTDAQVAAVSTYVLNNFGNKGGEVLPASIPKIRK